MVVAFAIVLQQLWYFYKTNDIYTNNNYVPSVRCIEDILYNDYSSFIDHQPEIYLSELGLILISFSSSIFIKPSIYQVQYLLPGALFYPFPSQAPSSQLSYE